MLGVFPHDKVVEMWYPRVVEMSVERTLDGDAGGLDGADNMPK